MNLPQNSLPVLGIALSVTLIACGGTTKRSIDSGHRSTTSRYDGNWLVYVQPATTIQKFEQWEFNCVGMQGQFPLQVKNGKVSAASDTKTGFQEAAINRRGEFLLRIPSGDAFEESSNSSVPIRGRDVTYIIQGNLSGADPGGQLTAAIVQFGNNGCKTNVRFERDK